VADQEGKTLYPGVIKVVSPVEIKILPKTGGGVQSLELTKLRDGTLTLIQP
jgi:hypothetical protein